MRILLLFWLTNTLFAQVDTHEFQYTEAGLVPYSSNPSGQPGSLLTIGDTLTVIQRPLLNIPTIVIPGEELEIICLAAESTDGWQAELMHSSQRIPLSISTATYDGDLGRWYLKALIPEPEVYELYDLKVTASNGLEDITRNSVQLIKEYKDSYYFVHITDTHLPTPYYYDNPESWTDSSSMVDLRAVIEDINLIHPEFVLLTGDVIHEGELEDFEERRYYTRAQRILAEFEVPVYVVAGNHDIGGWDSTPPSQGTARRDWWRFFGWPWLADPPVDDPMRTQNYSFDYGPVHYVGLEAYDNYDSYLYDIYGDASFTATQISWLHNNLFNASESVSKVLFYHYDFSNQINLSSLVVDLALWGHIHSNSGDINARPCDLATDAVCNGERSYRLIRVENGILHPIHTSYAGPDGDSLSVSYYPSNAGLADTVRADVTNAHAEEYEHGQLKFIMPDKGYGFGVENGILDQVISTDSTIVCYVAVDIPASNSVSVTVYVDTSLAIPGQGTVPGFALRQNYPNPFNPATRIEYSLVESCEVTLTVYDIRGREVIQLSSGRSGPGDFAVSWDGRATDGALAPAGIYIARLATHRNTEWIKMLLLR